LRKKSCGGRIICSKLSRADNTSIGRNFGIAASPRPTPPKKSSKQQPWVSPAERQAAGEAQARRIADQERRDREEKERQQAQNAEWERRAKAEADEAEARHIADQQRRDREEKERQQDADARRKAEQELRARDEEAQRVADQNSRRAEEERRRRQADIGNVRNPEDPLPQQSATQPQKPRRSWLRLIRSKALAIGAFFAVALLFFLVPWVKPDDVPPPPGPDSFNCSVFRFQNNVDAKEGRNPGH
jgi:hypothetical protein